MLDKVRLDEPNSSCVDGALRDGYENMELLEPAGEAALA